MQVNEQLLRQTLAARKMTIAELAGKMGVAPSTIYRSLKAGGKTFTLGQIAGIEEALELTKQECIDIFLS